MNAPAFPDHVPTTIPAALERAAARFGASLAVDEGEAGARLSFVELWQAARRAAASFIAYGLKHGDRVAVWAPNSANWIVATIGLQLAGGVLVPLNTRLKGKEAAYILNRSGARLLLTVRDFLGIDYPALLAGETLESVERTVLLDGTSEGHERWAEFLARGGAVPDSSVDAALAALNGDDLSDILFTSGTTGAPKGAMSTHVQTIQTSWSWCQEVGLGQGDRYLVVNPFFHSFGYKSGWLAALLVGATTLPHPVFDADNVMARIERERITVLPGPPTLYQSMLASPARSKFDLSSLRLAITGAAVVPKILVERMLSDLGFQIVLTGYGLTETCGTVSICAATDSVERVSQTSGRPLRGIEVKCIDGDGNPVPAGEPGEILVRGFNVMKGYFQDPEATAEAIDAQGWFRTGDIGIIDAAGYIRITDRKKDMFIVGGFNCYPAEIEGLLLTHPAITQVAVVGVPDERLGEVPKAFVILKPGHTLDAPTLIAWARASMANYKVPRFVEIVDELPTTASGKVQRFQLRN